MTLPSTLPEGQKPPEGTPAEKQPASQAEHMIPLSRFNEVNDEKKALETRIAAIEKEQKEALDKRLAEQNQFKELAEKRGADLEQANAKAAQVDAYEKTLKDVLASQIEAIPAEKRALVPDELNTQQKLAWIAKNAAILKAPASFDIGAGKHGGSGEDKVDLTPEEIATARQFGMTPEDYAKNK